MQRRLACVWQLAQGPTEITPLVSLALRSLSTLVPGAEFTVQRRFSADDVAAFVSLTGDANAIHIDAGAAAAAGLAAPILPGILMASLFPAIIGSAFPGAVYASQTLKFRRPAEVSCASGFFLCKLNNSSD
jgi:acyl dehydratase